MNSEGGDLPLGEIVDQRNKNCIREQMEVSSVEASFFLLEIGSL